MNEWHLCYILQNFKMSIANMMCSWVGHEYRVWYMFQTMPLTVVKNVREYFLNQSRQVMVHKEDTTLHLFFMSQDSEQEKLEILITKVCP